MPDDAVGAFPPAGDAVAAVSFAEVALRVGGGAGEGGAGAAAVGAVAPEDERVELLAVGEGERRVEADDAAVSRPGPGLFGGVVRTAAVAPLAPEPVGFPAVLLDEFLVGGELVENALETGGVHGSDAFVVDAVGEVLVLAAVVALSWWALPAGGFPWRTPGASSRAWQLRWGSLGGGGPGVSTRLRL